MPKPEPRPLRTLPERAFRARARLVAALLCCVCFAGLAARLAYLQLFTGSWYTSRALGQQLRDTVVPADRGRIYSADGALLAANSSCWTLRASPREMPEEKLRLAADGLAEILELDKAALLEKFSDRRSNDCLLRYRVERDIADRVRDFCEANGITGIRINQDSKRWYPQGEFLASVLGFTNVDNAGVSGLELKYNEVLTGQNGVVLTAVNAWGYTLEQSYETERVPLEGSGLRLTIDASIQHYLENALTYAVREHHVAARAVGIVMDVNTGAVLAMSTTPSYDPNQPRVLADKAARSMVDALTGVANRRSFDARLAESARCASVGMLMIDVDLFKNYNDSLGHPAGDKCLADVARAMQTTLYRHNDALFRYGGEEFAVILEDATERQALAVAERIMSGIRSLRLPHPDSVVAPHVTVSIGVAVARREEGGSGADLVARADSALYQAKARGKRRYAFYSSAGGDAKELHPAAAAG